MKPSSYTNLPPPQKVPLWFLRKRLHSLTGVFLVFFLIEHLLTNSESAFPISEQGSSFIRSVNFLQSLPYLPYIELFLLGVPIAVHLLLGIADLWYCAYNSLPSDGSAPSLPRFSRNQGFTFQRITALFLIFGIIAHVSVMRFIRHPEKVSESAFAIALNADDGLPTVAARLATTLITPSSQPYLLGQLQQRISSLKGIPSINLPQTIFDQQQTILEELITMQTFITDQRPTNTTWIALAPDFGTACLLLVRDTFTSPYRCVLYALFVLMAAFHATNGLWTASITWGATLNEQGRSMIRIGTMGLFMLFLLLGLSSIVGTYWITLYE